MLKGEETATSGFLDRFRDLIAAAVVVVFGVVWAYGSANASYHPAWFLPLTVAHFAVGAFIAKWWAMLLPFAIVTASIPAPTPEGADSATLGFVLIYEFVIGLPVLFVGVLVGRAVRGKGLFRDPDPWR